MGLDQALWIWCDQESRKRNQYVWFRREFAIRGIERAYLHLTASARYAAYLNGELTGQGPPRAWPQHYIYDSYDITKQLSEGDNTIEVLVHHFGVGNMQWLFRGPGLLVSLELQENDRTRFIHTDQHWRTRRETAFQSNTPRISIQLGFEEQYDARQASSDRDAPPVQQWQPAVSVDSERRRDFNDLHASSTPPLSAQTRAVSTVLQIETVRPSQRIWSIDLRPFFNDQDRSADHLYSYAFLFTRVHSPVEATARLIRLHATQSALRLNGQEIPARVVEKNYCFDFFQHDLPLRRGWNELLIDFRQNDHLTRFVAALDAPVPLRYDGGIEAEQALWSLIGPFDGPNARQHALSHFPFRNIPCDHLPANASESLMNRIWQARELEALLDSGITIPLRQEHFVEDDVFARAYSDEVIMEIAVPREGKSPFPIKIAPPEQSHDIRVLCDLGLFTVGQIEFEIEAPAGTILDLVGFEYRTRDGTLEWTEGTNNSMRYTCRDGTQFYRSFWRRGMRYIYLILRNLEGEALLHDCRMIEMINPQTNRGSFTCDDDRLNQIWRIGARTMACCSEDTYVDCPTYEQVHWVGDARNEALVDWIVNGDARLWHHCLLQTAQSLERSPLVESHVPSDWPIVLPAWSFLWMRSCREYLLYTGDRDGARKLWPWIKRQIAGIADFFTRDGLFEIRAWNMFDWADMDTPDFGVVTHQNCMLVLALQEIAETAQWLDHASDARKLSQMAENLKRAINLHLYNESKQAYVDARHPDGSLSSVFSQQTQTVALASGVAHGLRGDRAMAQIRQPPEDFVKAGSPFFMFFLLEALMQHNRTAEVLHNIRTNWGFMIDRGAETFWEMWSGKEERPTRSRCHGWSAAPTFFLSTHVLGIRPLSPGFATACISPHSGDLKRAAGKVPTPHGEITVEWEQKDDRRLHLRLEKPDAVTCEFDHSQVEFELLN